MPSRSSNVYFRKLGIPSAQTQLYRRLLFWLAAQAGLLECFRCHENIKRWEDFSIDHKEPWRFASDPIEAYFNSDNIAFSHLGCNRMSADLIRNHRARRITHCPQGHAYDVENTYLYRGGRLCKTCHRDSERLRRRRLRHSTI